MVNVKNSNDNQAWFIVRDFDFKCPGKIHSFVPSTGEREVDTIADTSNIEGWGSERKIGLFKQKKIFVAIYLDKDALMLWIDGFLVNLRSKDIVVERKHLFGTFTYYFSIRQNLQIVKSFWYSFVTFESFPDDRDIFTYIVQTICQSRKSIEQMFFLMKAGLDGRSLLTDPKLQNQMEDHLRRQLNE